MTQFAKRYITTTMIWQFQHFLTKSSFKFNCCFKRLSQKESPFQLVYQTGIQTSVQKFLSTPSSDLCNLLITTEKISDSCELFYKKSFLTQFFSMHHFSTSWKQLKTSWFSDVLREQRNGTLGANGLTQPWNY